jgi:hypothetical protein
MSYATISLDSTLSEVRMNLRTPKESGRKSATAEIRQDAMQKAAIEERFRKWKRGTMFLGIALVSSIGGVVPF